MRKELLKGLTEEQIKKVEACKSSDEILALAKAEGIELSEEQLEAVSGGGCMEPAMPKCKHCGEKNNQEIVAGPDSLGRHQYKCGKCGTRYWFG